MFEKTADYRAIPVFAAQALIGLLSVALLAVPFFGAAGQRQVAAFELFTVPWGDRPAEVSFREAPGGRFGPQSFCVFQEGQRIAVLDSAHERILIFSKEGDHLGTVHTRGRGDDLIVTSESIFLVLHAASHAVDAFDHQGRLVASYHVPATGSPAARLVELAAGQIAVETAGGAAYRLAPETSQGEPAAAEQVARPVRVRLRRHIEGSLVEVRVVGEAVTFEFSVLPEYDRIETIQVLSSHPNQGIWLVVEEATVAGHVVRAARKYDSQGKIIVEAQIPPSAYADSLVDLRVSADGQLYQMSVGEDGVTLLHWRPLARPALEEDALVDIPRLTGMYRDHREGDVEGSSGDTVPKDATNASDWRGSSVDQSTVLARAETYRNHDYWVSTSNISPYGGDWCDGKTVETPIRSPGSYLGVVYKWGGFSGLSTASSTTDCGYYFDSGLAVGLYAGDQNTSTDYGSCCAVGVDCSGFVSQVWDLEEKYSTSGLPLVSCGLPSIDNLLPGDIVISSPERHTRLFSQREESGYYTCYEASGRDWKVSRYSYSASDLSGLGYVAYRKKTISGLMFAGDRVQTLYDLNVRDCAGLSGCNVIATEPSGAAGTISSTPVNADGYTWWYVSYDSGNSGWSVQCYLQPQPCSEPGSFQLSSPSHQSEFPDTTTSLTLIWTSSSDADVYDVYYGTSPSPSLYTSTSNSWLIVNVSPGATYYWNVAAKNSCGTTDSDSGTWSFSITEPCSPPGSFSLTSPAHGSQFSAGTSQVTLAWNVATDATSYELYFGSNPSPPLHGTTTETSQAVPVSSGTTYYWTVAATNSYGSTAASSGPWSLIIEAASDDEIFSDGFETGDTFAWSGSSDLNETRLAFHSNRDTDPLFEIYTIRPDGTGLSRLTNNSADEGGATWSPDGMKIAFWSDRDGNGEIYVMNANGSDQTRLTFDPASDSTGSFSPDGTHIVFTSNRDGDNEIYVMGSDGSNVVQLTFNSTGDQRGLWSPDGATIAFMSDRGGDSDIYAMDTTGNDVTQLTFSSAQDSPGAWSPDGTKIVYYNGYSGDYDIWVMNADGSNNAQLTAVPGNDSNPTWSPDGTKIAFLSDRDQAWIYEIYIMNPDGSEHTRITFDSTQDYQPSWSPGSVPQPPGNPEISARSHLPGFAVESFLGGPGHVGDSEAVRRKGHLRRLQ